MSGCGGASVVVAGRSEDRDAAVQACGEDVVGRQGHEHVVVVRIDGDRVPGPGSPVHRGHHLDQSLIVGVDDPEDRTARVVAGGRVIPPVALVEPHFVGATHALHHAVDAAGPRVHDDLAGGG